MNHDSFSSLLRSASVAGFTVSIRGAAPKRRSAVGWLLACVLALLTLSLPVHAAVSVPFRGSDLGTFWVTPVEGPLVFTEDVVVGHGTLVGQYTVYASEYFNLETLEVTGGTWTMIAADGSTLFGTYSGWGSLTEVPGVVTYRASGPVTGGTGRFLGVSGFLTFDGRADLNTGILSDVVTGELILPRPMSVGPGRTGVARRP